MLSPAEPVVWIILFSKMVVLRKNLLSAMAITAMGMEAETVKPAFNARYTVAAPKMIPKQAPVMTAFHVNSFMAVSGAINGTNFFSDIAVDLDIIKFPYQFFINVCSLLEMNNNTIAAIPDMMTNSMKKS